MLKYPKIDSVFKRDEKTGLFIPEWSQPEFEYLKNNMWEWEEKIDGMNVRVIWSDGNIEFRGRTDKAQLPSHLFEKLKELFPPEKFSIFDGEVILFGEGFGYKINKGGKYLGKNVDFALFDVWIGMWLKREDVKDIAKKMGLLTPPIVGEGTIYDAIQFVHKGFKSAWGDADAEGVVMRPKIELLDRRGRRIITKLKFKDFARGYDDFMLQAMYIL